MYEKNKKTVFLTSLVVALILLNWLLFITPTGASDEQEPVKGKNPKIELGVTYVGNRIVDLYWYDYVWMPPDDPVTEELKKDGNVILSYDPWADSHRDYRDENVNKGETHTYQLVKYNSTVTVESNELVVIVGKVGGGNLCKDVTWKKAYSPYVITNDWWWGGLAVLGATLTIEPGVVVRFEADESKDISCFGLGVYEKEDATGGILHAVGTKDDPIYFFGDPNAQVQNRGRIDFSYVYPPTTSCNSILKHCVVKGLYEIICLAKSPTIYNNTIIESKYGVYCHHASPEIKGNIISNNSVGVYCEGNCNPIINNNWIFDNKLYGVQNEYSSITINAENNWWGNITGPYYPVGNPNGTGDKVSGFVDYDPWLELPDLTISKILVVQVIEGGKLVADKETVVRVFVDTGWVRTEFVNVKLFVDGVPYEPEENNKVVFAKINDYTPIQRYNCEDTFNFYIGELSKGKHKLKAVVDPDDKILEINETNNELEIEIEVEGTKGIRIWFRQLVSLGFTNTKSVWAFAEEASLYFRDVYPISYKNYNYKIGSSVGDTKIPFEGDRLDMIEVAAWFKSALIWHNIWNEPNMDFCVVVLPSNYLGSDTDGASIRGFRSAPLVDEASPHTMAHEIGHFYDLGFPEEYDVDPNGLGNQIKDVPIYKALDNSLEYIITPPAPPTYCFMGSSVIMDSAWVEPDCYNKLYSKLVLSGSKNSGMPGYRSSNSSEILFVNGVIHQNGTVTLYPWYRLNVTSAEPESIPEGNYSIVCLSANNEVLNSVKFDAYFEDINYFPFVFTIPYPEGTAKVVIKHNTTVIKEVIPSSNAPIVTVVTPNGGESITSAYQVTWSVSDADGDDLRYSLLYSKDGGTSWTPIAQDLYDTSYSWNSSEVPGSTNCLIKVVATDGFNIGEDDSDNPFSITKKAPEVWISSPADNSKFAFGTEVVFSGYGYDLEDGQLSGSSLSWNSDKDWYLGQGNYLSISNLSLGEHKITLSTIDGDGLIGNHTITMLVVEDTISPIIHTIEIIPSVAYTNQSLLIKAQVTDDVGIAEFGVAIEIDGEGTYLWYNKSSGLYEGVAKAPLLPGIYVVNVMAVDTVGHAVYSTTTLTVNLNRAPSALITSPLEAQKFKSGEDINFVGSGIDEEDGALKGQSLIWVSNIDGGIGYGTSFNTSNLSIGLHTVTLMVIDGGGLSAFYDVNIRVTEAEPPDKITGLTAVDAKDGKIHLSWSMSTITDFKEYGIYQSTEPITNVSGMTPIIIIPDESATSYYVEGLENNKKYYFAVTAVDINGNENFEVSCVSAVPTATEEEFPRIWAVIAAVAVIAIVGGVSGIFLRRRKLKRRREHG